MVSCFNIDDHREDIKRSHIRSAILITACSEHLFQPQLTYMDCRSLYGMAALSEFTLLGTVDMEKDTVQ